MRKPEIMADAAHAILRATRAHDRPLLHRRGSAQRGRLPICAVRGEARRALFPDSFYF